MDPNSFEDLLRTQRMMASRIMNDASMDMKINLLELIRNLTSGKKNKIQVELVIYEAQIEGISEQDTLKLLEELKSDHLIADIDDGNIRLL